MIQVFTSSLFVLYCAHRTYLHQQKMSPLSTISNKNCLTISLAHSIFILGRYVHFEKFANVARTSSSRSRLHFILNWGVRAAVSFFVFPFKPTTHFVRQAYWYLLCHTGKSSSIHCHRSRPGNSNQFPYWWWVSVSMIQITQAMDFCKKIF